MSTVVGQTAGRRRTDSLIGAAAAGIDTISRTRTARFIGLAVAAVVGVVGSLATVAAPAAAAVPGLIRVSAASVFSPEDKKTVLVTCPAGKKLVGTGGRIDGATGKVVIAQLWPDGSPTAAPTSVTAVAQETDPISQDWRLTVYGMCANPLPGLVRISVRSAGNQSEDVKGAVARCPTGKKVVGTGFSVAHGHGQVSIDKVGFLDLAVNPMPDDVFVHAREHDPLDGDWWLYAHAICADYLFGLRVYSAGVESPVPNDESTVSAACPPGKVLLGAGFGTEPLLPYPGLVVDNVLDDFTPNGGSTTPPTSVRVTHYEEDSNTNAWLTIAHAICAYESGY